MSGGAANEAGGGNVVDARKHRELVASAASAKAALRALTAALAADEPAHAAAAAAERAAAAVGTLRTLLGGALDAAHGDGLQRLPLDTSRRLVEVDLPAAWGALLDAAPLPGAPDPLCPAVADVAAATADALGLLAATSLRACARATDPLRVLLQLAGSPLMAACTRRLDSLRAAAEAADASSEAAADAARAAAALSAPYATMAAVAGGHDPEHVFEELHSRLAASLGSTGFLAAACGALLTAASARPRARSSDGGGGGGGSEDSAAALARTCEQASENLLTVALFLSGADCAGTAAAAAGSDAPRTGVAHMAASEAHAAERAAEGLPAWGSWKPPAAGDAKPPCSCAVPLPPGGLSVALGACEREGGLVVAACDDAVPGDPESPGARAACDALDASDSPLGSAGLTPSRRGSAHSARGAGGCAACMDADGYSHDAPLPAMLVALSAPQALAFLEERAAHALRDSRVAADAVVMPAASAVAPMLLPGRASSASNGAAVVALRVLVCWRALLRGGTAAVRSSLAAPGGAPTTLMAALLFAAAPQQGGGRAGAAGASAGLSFDALGARCTVAAAECLLFAVEHACSNAEGLRALLPVVAGGAASAVLAAAGAWEKQQRLGRGQELAYSGQLKCSERSTGEALRCQCRAAAMAADAVCALLVALRDCPGLSGGTLEAVSVLVPALEVLFRRVPAASAAHVSAASLLVVLLPAYAAELTHGPAGSGAPTAAVVSVLVTLRKFLTRCAGLQGTDRFDAAGVGLNAAGLLTCLLRGTAAAAPHGHGGPAGALVTFAVAQLLPGLQVGWGH
jgi:hypothetical protein